MMRRWLLFTFVLIVACHRAPDRMRFQGAPVILISIDTLRSDHLPAYGYDKVETPNIDAFRRDAILFRHAYSHCPMTLPSHISMLTGLLPPEHGVRDNVGFRFDACDLDVDRRRRLGRSRQGLAQLDLGRAEPAQLLAEPARARAAGVDLRAERRLEPRGGPDGGGERLVEPLGCGEHTRQLMRTRPAAAGANGGVDACRFRGARPIGCLGRLCRCGIRRRDKRARLGAKELCVASLGLRHSAAAEPHEVALGTGRALGGGRELAASRALLLAERA